MTVGVYVRVEPEPESVPCAGGVTIAYVSGSPSMSVALSGTSSGVSSATRAELSIATGGSLTGVTVSATKAESVPPFPSEIE